MRTLQALHSSSRRATVLWTTVACVFGLLACPLAAAEDGSLEDAAVRRTVIGLYEGRPNEPYPEVENPIAILLELPLNHLGMVVRTHDIREGPPPAAWLEDARAVVTWFTGHDPSPAWLWPWLEAAVDEHGLRVVHFQDLGCLLTEGRDREAVTPWLRRFGLEWRLGYAVGAAAVEATYVDDALCAFERDARKDATHAGPRSTGEGNRVWVETRLRSGGDEVRTPVVTGPWGGFAMGPWTLRYGAEDGMRRWHLDPFAFCREALGLARVPAPHPSVRNGRRMFVFHIDGDAFEGASRDPAGVSCARVFLDEIFERFRVPTTASIIVAGLVDRLEPRADTEGMRTARAIFALPHVEAASHGTLHPFRWGHTSPEDVTKPEDLAYASLAGFTFTPANEVRDSVRFIRKHLLPEGRACDLMLWTGDTLPPASAILAADALGCANMNGGTYRWDPAFDSVGYVSPWVRRVGDAIQVHAGAANENEFPGYYTQPAVFANVDTTIERTGRGRILKPANVYVHFYSAEYRPRLDIVKRLVKRWGFEEPTIPVFASTYANAVRSALDARIERTESGWRLSNFGACRTARIDDEPRDVDFERSTGLSGARRIDDALYVHLTGPDAVLVLSEAAPLRPHLEQANHLLEDVVLESAAVRVTSRAHVARALVFAGFASGAAVRVRVGASEGTDTSADERGRVTLELPPGGPDRVEVRTR